MVNNTLFSKKLSFYFALIGLFVLYQHTALAGQTYRFGVTNVETVMTTAAQWNPILAWLEQRTGIRLTLQMGMNAEDTQARLMRGEYDFFLGYPLLQDAVREPLGFRVLLKSKNVSNRSAIVVQAKSRYRSLSDLKEAKLWVTHESAFIAHTLPMAALSGAAVKVRLQSVSNQESLVMAFKMGQIPAAALNLGMFERAMAGHSEDYRILWSSADLPSLPIGVQNSVPLGVAERVQAALIEMVNDEAGQKILQSLNRRMGAKLSGWQVATDAEYQFAIAGYRQLERGKLACDD